MQLELGRGAVAQTAPARATAREETVDAPDFAAYSPPELVDLYACDQHTSGRAGSALGSLAVKRTSRAT
jgi:hypothetical protein